MTRCARDRRVFFVEEPVFDRPPRAPWLELQRGGAVTVVVPHLPEGLASEDLDAKQRVLIEELIRAQQISEYLLWYYTPMALPLTAGLSPVATVYDCMDELSAFKDAPCLLKSRELDLMQQADLVLTGGQSLYEAKQHQHDNIHPFPSSVDVPHFAAARRITADPPDQASIPRPRLGFFGVIDERMDLALVDGVAAARPDWQLVMLGPVVKIDSMSLPRRRNIHYLGAKPYDALPEYLSGWDVALLPFAHNQATRFISPTKTPEYLAAGCPVVSTSIRDVDRPYGQQGLARIADDVGTFVRACTAAMAEDRTERITRVDAFLRQTSWDGTWNRIHALVELALSRNRSLDSQSRAKGAAAV